MPSNASWAGSSQHRHNCAVLYVQSTLPSSQVFSFSPPFCAFYSSLCNYRTMSFPLGLCCTLKDHYKYLQRPISGWLGTVAGPEERGLISKRGRVLGKSLISRQNWASSWFPGQVEDAWPLHQLVLLLELVFYSPASCQRKVMEGNCCVWCQESEYVDCVHICMQEVQQSCVH